MRMIGGIGGMLSLSYFQTLKLVRFKAIASLNSGKNKLHWVKVMFFWAVLDEDYELFPCAILPTFSFF